MQVCFLKFVKKRSTVKYNSERNYEKPPLDETTVGISQTNSTLAATTIGLTTTKSTSQGI